MGPQAAPVHAGRWILPLAPSAAGASMRITGADQGASACLACEDLGAAAAAVGGSINGVVWA